MGFGGVALWHGAIQINLTCFVICAGPSPQKNKTKQQQQQQKKRTPTHNHTCTFVGLQITWAGGAGMGRWRRRGMWRKIVKKPPPTDSQLPCPSTPSCNLHSSTGSLKPCVRPPPTNYLATLPLSPAQAWCCCMMGFLYIEFHLLVR